MHLLTGEMRDARFAVPNGETAVHIVDARMVNVDFAAVQLSRLEVRSSVLEGCDFTRAAFDSLDLGWGTGQSVYRDCLFRRTRFAAHTFWGNTRFERCLFDGARLRNMIQTFDAEFVDCVFRGKLREINFWGRPADGGPNRPPGRAPVNDFRGNDFTEADLAGVAFNGIDLRAQRFPGLPDYAVLDRMPERTDAVSALVDAWPDDETKRSALFSLRLEAELAAEHNAGAALVSRTNFGYRLPPDVRSQLFDLLVNYSDDQQ